MRKKIYYILTLLTSVALCSCSHISNTTSPPPSSFNAETILLEVDPICQYPDFPTGCEATATVTALKFFGDNISVDAFIDNYLPTDNTFYRKGLTLYGPNPYEVFVGDPRTTASYGCFAPVIKQALIKYASDRYQIIDTSDQALFSLCENYIDNNIPVLIWASCEMAPFSAGQSWCFADGTYFTWPSGEHCLLLVGYNQSDYFFCDPRHTEIVSYSHDDVTKRYKDLRCQSLVIKPT